MLKCNATYTWQSVLKGPRSQHCISVFHYPTLVTVPIAMTSCDIITNQHELPVLCAVQITKKVFHNTPCFFPPGPFILYIGFSKVVCGIGRAEWCLPRPMEGPPPPFPMGPGFLFFLLIPMVIMEFLCLVSMHNGVINYVAIGVSSTQCVQPICASQRGGGRGHTCWKTSIHTGPKECTSHGSLLDL